MVSRFNCLAHSTSPQNIFPTHIHTLKLHRKFYHLHSVGHLLNFELIGKLAKVRKEDEGKGSVLIINALLHINAQTAHVLVRSENPHHQMNKKIY